MYKSLPYGFFVLDVSKGIVGNSDLIRHITVPLGGTPHLRVLKERWPKTFTRS